MRFFSRLFLVGGLFLLVLSWWYKDELPPPAALRAELLEDPRQLPLSQAPFPARAGGVDYAVKPLYRYELYGLVVSRHDSDTWWDYIHKEWNDQLNVADLCVVFGNNARSGAYRDLHFSSGQFVCYFETASGDAFAAFDQAAISNNHLLTTDAGIARRIRETRVGDQIHFSGYLAEYSHQIGHGFRRGTSTVRTDTGNGACETVFLENFKIIKRGGGAWPLLFKLSFALIAGGLLLWLMAPVRFRD